jgi:hypothetical protein
MSYRTFIAGLVIALALVSSSAVHAQTSITDISPSPSPTASSTPTPSPSPVVTAIATAIPTSVPTVTATPAELAPTAGGPVQWSLAFASLFLIFFALLQIARRN